MNVLEVVKKTQNSLIEHSKRLSETKFDTNEFYLYLRLIKDCTDILDETSEVYVGNAPDTFLVKKIETYQEDIKKLLSYLEK